MHRIDNLYVWVIGSDLCQRVADLLKTAAKAFPTMPGDQNHLLTVGEKRITLSQLVTQRFIAQYPIAHPKQRINNRIAGYRDPIIGNIFPQQVLPRGFRRRKMVRCQMPGQRAVPLFRPRRTQIARAQSGFHVPHRNALIESGKACRHRRGGIAMHQHHIWLKRLQHRL